MKTFWFDFTNTPHVNFLKPIILHYSREHKQIFSCREFAETVSLLKMKICNNPIVSGTYGGKSKILKSVKLLSRLLTLSRKIPEFDVLFSCGSTEASLLSQFRKRKAVSFDDNETSPNWMYSRFVNLALFPRIISRETLLHQGFKEQSLYQYDGYKEHIYLADFEPDERFLDEVPFRDYWVVRPENLKANYLGGKCDSIVPELLKLLEEEKFNVLYLPRYDEDKEFAKGKRNMFIPEKPIDGLNACYFSQGVMTGAGTFAREAACMGKVSVSFYAGGKLLAVDKNLISENRIYHSRDPQEILRWISRTEPREGCFEKAKEVKQEVLSMLDKFISSL
jgi:uncharacterized protein